MTLRKQKAKTTNERKLTDEQVRVARIRGDAMKGPNLRQLARQWRVSYAAVWAAANRETYVDVRDAPQRK